MNVVVAVVAHVEDEGTETNFRRSKRTKHSFGIGLYMKRDVDTGYQPKRRVLFNHNYLLELLYLF